MIDYNKIDDTLLAVNESSIITQVKNNPSGYYHPGEIAYLFKDDKVELSKLFTMDEWLQYYLDVCSDNIPESNDIEKERDRIVKELFSKLGNSNSNTIKEQIMMFGYNPELPYTFSSIRKQSIRLNSMIHNDYIFIEEGEWSLTLRNLHLMISNFMKDASRTGNFKGLRKNLLKIAKSCKTIDEVNFLRNDRNKAKPYLNKLAENKPKLKEVIDEHIEWLDTEYKEALNNKAKELKNINESAYIEESYKNMTPVYIVLSRTYSHMSNVIHKITGDQYTHSSISFDLNLDKIFSFNGKGFVIENLDLFKSFGNIPFAIYGVMIDNKSLLKMKMALNEFISKKDKLHYSQLGLLGVLFNKPIIFDNRKFCSEFVDGLLKLGNIDITGKNSALVRPQEFINQKIMFKVFEGNVNDYDISKANKVVKKITHYSESYIKEATLPVEFDKEGNLIVKNNLILDYQKEYQKSHKLLLGYDKTNNIEGMRYEVAKLWYLNSKLEDKLYNMDISSEDKKKYMDIRARILNDFNKYFKEISKDKDFNFREYYVDTPFSTDSLKISKHTVFHTVNIAKQLFRP